MINDLPSFTKLLKHLQQVPYLASKNLYRVALHFLTMNESNVEEFCAVLLHAKNYLKQCEVCCCWKEKDQECLFCNSAKRDQSTVCVVEQWQEVFAIEKTGGYSGVYHVLGGAICPLEGIGPEDLAIDSLILRAKNDGIQEVILATNQTPEGEATAAYIASKLKNLPVKISCLARGVPVGSSLEFMDRLTVYKALSERRLF